MRIEAASPASCPLALIASAFAAGIVVARAFESAAFLLPAAAASGAILALASGGGRLRTALLLAGFIFAGSFAGIRSALPPDPSTVRSQLESGKITEDSPVEIEGVVAWGPEPIPGGFYVDVDCRRLRSNGPANASAGRTRFFVSVRDAEARREFEDLQLRPGVLVTVDARLSRGDRYRNPGSSRYSDLLDRKGLDASGSVKSPLLIQRTGTQEGWAVRSAFVEVRRRLLDVIVQRLPPESAGLMAASLLGNRYYLDGSTAEAFREGGTYHLMVVSGLHVTLLGAAVLVFLSPLRLRDPCKYLAASLTVWTFAGVSGLGLPVTRAALLFTFVALARAFYRESNSLNSLGACVILILVADPLSIFDPSFQLTVTSAGAIVGAAFPAISRMREIGGWFPSPARPYPPHASEPVRRICELIYWSGPGWKATMSGSIWQCGLYKSPMATRFGGGIVQKVCQRIFEGFVVSFLVQTFLLPFAVTYFHRIAPSSPFNNLPAAVLLVVQDVLAMIAAISYPISLKVSGAFSSLAVFAARSSLFIQDALTAALGGSFRTPIYSGWARSFYSLFLTSLVILTILVSMRYPLLRRPDLVRQHIFRRLFVSFLLIAPTLFGSLIILHPYSAPVSDGRLRLDFLDVGQGDSIFVTFPDGTTMLVDGGGRPDFAFEEGQYSEFRPDTRKVGESVVSEFLWEHGYSRVDRILATHSDADHLSGLVNVARNFDVGAAWYGYGSGNGVGFRDLREVLERRSVPLRPLSAGDRFEAGGATAEILNPGNAKTTDNNRSVVLRITYGSRSFLLTGDIEEQAEKVLLDSVLVKRTDVVKVAHHGSRTSSSSLFVSAVRPEYAIVSVGRRSPFGHPHREVVDRWLAAGAKVLTTGKCGTITIATDGSRLDTQTYAGGFEKCRERKTPGGF